MPVATASHPHANTHRLDNLVDDLRQYLHATDGGTVPTIAVGHSMESAAWTTYLSNTSSPATGVATSTDSPECPSVGKVTSGGDACR